MVGGIICRMPRRPIPSMPAGTALTTPPGAWRSLARGQMLGLLLILGLAAGLRLYAISDSSFWLDEFCSMEVSTGRGLAHVALPTNVFIASPGSLTSLAGARPWWSIWTSMRLDNHPPLYFILLRFWRDLFGEGDTAARSMSLIPSLAAIIFLFDAVLVSTRVPLVALAGAALMAVAMPQVHFAQEARGYSLLVATELAACAALVRCQCLGFSPRRAIAMACAVLAMLLTHYYAVAPLAALGIYALCRLRDKARFKAIAAMFAAGLIFAVAWGPFLWQQHSSVAANNSWQIDGSSKHVSMTVLRAAVLPLRLLSENLAVISLDPERYCALAPIAAIAYVAPLFLLRKRPHLLLWYLIFILPVCMVMAIDLADHRLQTSIVRYTQLAGPGLYVLIAAAFAEARPRYRYLFPAVTGLACLATISRVYSSDTDSQLLADALNADAHAGVPVVFASAGRPDWYAGALYLMVSHYADVRGPILLLTRPAPPGWDQWLPQQTTLRLWLVCGRPIDRPDRLLPGVPTLTGPDNHVFFPAMGADLWKIDRPPAAGAP